MFHSPHTSPVFEGAPSTSPPPSGAISPYCASASVLEGPSVFIGTETSGSDVRLPCSRRNSSAQVSAFRCNCTNKQQLLVLTTGVSDQNAIIEHNSTHLVTYAKPFTLDKLCSSAQEKDSIKFLAIFFGRRGRFSGQTASSEGQAKEAF
jgi:hypothetical protein